MSTTTTTAPAQTAVEPAPQVKGASSAGLVTSGSCSSLLEHLRQQALSLVGPYGISGRRWAPPLEAQVLSTSEGSSALPRTGESPTNVQEEGVDEPDIVKSDGRLLVAVVGRSMHVVDVSGPAPRRTAAWDVGADARELFLAGDRVLLLSSTWVPAPSPPGHSLFRMATVMTIADVSNPDAPVLAGRLTVQGSYVSARMVDGVARVVVTSEAQGPRFESPASEADQARATDANRKAIQASTLADWLPSATVERPGQVASTAVVSPCAQVLRPQHFSGLSTVTVLTVDPRNPKLAASSSVLGGGNTVYASTRNLFVATRQYVEPTASSPPTDTSTEIHQFSTLAGAPARYVATGEVPGFVPDQFSMSEHEGYLRVASTKRAAQGPSESLVSVLALRAPRLATVGRVDGLGRGEDIYAVRFVGSRGYVVTFRQIDPLYVVDLHDPNQPVVRGELKLPGYSSYLHPVSDTLLVGIGQDATEEGRPMGTQLVLFDVSDPAAPVRRQVVTLPEVTSEAEWDHHAFTWWPNGHRVFVPFVEWRRDGSEQVNGAAGILAIRVDLTGGPGDVVRLEHPVEGASIRRALVHGDRLLTVSDAGVMTSDLGTLETRDWVPFGT